MEAVSLLRVFNNHIDHILIISTISFEKTFSNLFLGELSHYLIKYGFTLKLPFKCLVMKFTTNDLLNNIAVVFVIPLITSIIIHIILRIQNIKLDFER